MEGEEVMSPDTRDNLHMLISGAAGMVVGKGLLDYNAVLLLLGLLLFVTNLYLQKTRKKPKPPPMSMRILVGGDPNIPFFEGFPDLSSMFDSARNCKDEMKKGPIIFPACQGCRDTLCKKSPNYKTVQQQGESDKEYKERMA